jgi:DAK2 domain fusion protein YloV
MSTKRITGFQLEQMLKNGLANLQRREEEINRLNVFPVSDGDTGTNMRLTLSNGLRFAKTKMEANAYLKQLSEGMLLGARGNSGVILSQFFKGFYVELSRCGVIGIGEMRNALVRGYRAAYSAVVKPVEGTILTVTREGIEHIRTQITRNTTIEQLLAMYIAEMKKTLALTPEMLSVLKEAGVIDSGALGFITIFEGMLKYLYGDVMLPQAMDEPEVKTVNLELFNENSAFEDGYCMEFILQLMNADKYNRHFRISSFIEDLKLYGNSIVAVQDGKRVKVHIHTLIPAKIITLAQEFGEFLTFKLENMQVQHNEHDKELIPKKHKALAKIAVVNGSGMKKLYKGLGCDIVIDGGTTMNTSSQEFVDAFAQLDADRIVVFPNNPNIILAAEQAVKLVEAKNITVLPSKSIAEGYFAIAMDVPISDDLDFRISEMKVGLDNTVTLSQTAASRDYAFHEISCKKGDEILLIDNKLVCVNSDPVQAVLDGFDTIEDIDDRETCVIFRGEAASDEQQETLEDALSERYPLLEIEFVDGGQVIYPWIIGLA